MINKFLFFIFLVIGITSCNKEKKIEEQSAIDKVLIEDYITVNSLSGEFNASDLWYNVENQGGGVQAYSGATVKVIYSGYLLNGTQFDQSPSDGVTFSLNNVISGWQQGIPKFKEGGNGKLIIPSLLGYGTEEKSGIPSNSVLIFDIELVDVL